MAVANHIWEEPLYRLVLQISLLQILFLATVVLGIVAVRAWRIHQGKRQVTVSAQLYTPLMSYLAGDSELEVTYGAILHLPRHWVCLELERYTSMLTGGARSRIQALYVRLDLMKRGVRLCRSYFWWRRLEGVRLLGASGGQEAVATLIQRLWDRHDIVRLAAARALGGLDAKSAIAPLLESITRADQLSRRQLAQTLVAFGPAVHPVLRQILRQDARAPQDSRFTAMILEVLALTGDTGSAHEVKAALDSDNIEIRIAAYKAAVLLHLTLEPEQLQRGLADKQWPVRAQAALAAGKLGDQQVVDQLGVCLGDQAWWVRYNAGVALLQHGAPGVAELERVRQDSEDRFARDMAARALTSDPSYYAMQELRDHCLRKDRVVG